jgi:Ca-activated chloride channel family protein
VPYGFTFSATVHGTGGLRRIESPSHPVAIDLDGPRATVTLSQEHSALDRDLVLLITPGDALGPQITLERSPSGRIAASIVFRPSFAASRVPADVVFLIDRSGSMQGSSIEQVCNALQLCLRSLESGCAFDIVGFGSSFESLFGECRAYDERSLADAHRHVASLQASLGGTELLPALESVLSSAARRERVLQLVVLTDGQVTNTDAVLDAVRRCRDRVRVFTFGIGRGASHHLVRGLARAGRGAAEFIYPGERIEAKVMRQFARALAPAMTDMQIDWGALRATQVPSGLGSCFADEPLRSYAWLDEVDDGVVTLRGRGPNGPLSWSLNIRRDDVVNGTTIGTLTARARIREIEEGGEWSAARGSQQRDRKNDHTVSEVVRLAMEYGLASRDTSLVAIEKREVPMTQGVVLRRVPIAITSGWGGSDRLPGLIGFGGVMARSSTSMDQTGEFFQTAFDAAPLDEPLRVERAMRQTTSWTAGWLDRVRRGRTSRSTSASEVPSSRALDRLVALQHADGSWDLDTPLADVIGVSLKELESRLAGATGARHDIRRAWATALALTYLTKRASESRQEWKLLAQKATRWLEHAAAVPPSGTSWLDYAAREFVE